MIHSLAIEEKAGSWQPLLKNWEECKCFARCMCKESGGWGCMLKTAVRGGREKMPALV
jgi:hypothetical protein